MGWTVVSVVGLLGLIGVVVALAAPATARWERERRRARAVPAGTEPPGRRKRGAAHLRARLRRETPSARRRHPRVHRHAGP
jgi:hypothetical protein